MLIQLRLDGLLGLTLFHELDLDFGLTLLLLIKLVVDLLMLLLLRLELFLNLVLRLDLRLVKLLDLLLGLMLFLELLLCLNLLIGFYLKLLLQLLPLFLLSLEFVLSFELQLGFGFDLLFGELLGLLPGLLVLLSNGLGLDSGNLLGVSSCMSGSLESLLLCNLGKCLLLGLLFLTSLLKSLVLCLGLLESLVLSFKLLNSRLLCLGLCLDSQTSSLQCLCFSLHSKLSLLLNLNSHVGKLLLTCHFSFLGLILRLNPGLGLCLSLLSQLLLLLGASLGLVSRLHASCLHGLLPLGIEDSFLLANDLIDNVAVAIGRVRAVTFFVKNRLVSEEIIPITLFDFVLVLQFVRLRGAYVSQ